MPGKALPRCSARALRREQTKDRERRDREYKSTLLATWRGQRSPELVHWSLGAGATWGQPTPKMNCIDNQSLSIIARKQESRMVNTALSQETASLRSQQAGVARAEKQAGGQAFPLLLAISGRMSPPPSRTSFPLNSAAAFRCAAGLSPTLGNGP